MNQLLQLFQQQLDKEQSMLSERIVMQSRIDMLEQEL